MTSTDEDEWSNDDLESLYLDPDYGTTDDEDEDVDNDEEEDEEEEEVDNDDDDDENDESEVATRHITHIHI